MVPIKFNETSDYVRMEVLGVDGVFTSLRIDENTLPEGFFKYSLRDGDSELFSTIEKNVTVDHAGDFITKQEIDLGPEGFKDLQADDWGFTEDEYEEKFDFEAYFGCKLSLDCQIEKANAKKDAQLGGNAKAKDKEAEQEQAPEQEQDMGDVEFL